MARFFASLLIPPCFPPSLPLSFSSPDARLVSQLLSHSSLLRRPGVEIPLTNHPTIALYHNEVHSCLVHRRSFRPRATGSAGSTVFHKTEWNRCHQHEVRVTLCSIASSTTHHLVSSVTNLHPLHPIPPALLVKMLA